MSFISWRAGVMLTGRVFISHTADMAQFPQSCSFVQGVLDAVNRAGLVPVDMRYFAARDGKPAEYCRAQVRECQIYVVVVGFRYGSMVPGEAVSYTELEFNEASAAGLPRLVFLLDDPAGLPGRLVDPDRGAIKAFRQRLLDRELLVRGFDSAARLELEVFHALTALKDLPAGVTSSAPERAASTRRDGEVRRRSTASRWQRRSLAVLLALGLCFAAFELAAAAELPVHMARWSLPVYLLMLLIGAIWTAITYLSGRRRSFADDSAELDQAARKLAGAVRDQWTAAAVDRGLWQPHPLRVRWSVTRRPVATEPSVLFKESDQVNGRVPSYWRGDVQEIVVTFRRLPRRQLVVLGEPGAGKTVLAMMLITGLLEEHEPQDPVPVLLSLSSWRPDTEHLHSWIARRLAEDYDFRADMARKLVTTGRIMPVLDGLDEAPAALHAAAIESIDRAAGTRPLVVTCRATEYEAAVAAGGWVLASAMTVELEPVWLQDAAKFLTATAPEAARWGPVFRRVGSEGNAPLARVLSSPLMVSLARTVYRAPTTDPAELLDACRFPDANAVEYQLLDGFVAAVYANRPAFSATGHRRRFTCSAKTAERWLTFLACHLNRLGSSDLAWWQVSWTLPRSAAGLLTGLTSALSVALPLGITFGLAGTPFDGLIFGLTFGSAAGLASGVAVHVTTGLHIERPTWLRTQLSQRTLGLGMRFGLPIGLVGALLFGIQADRFGAVRGLETGLVVVLLATVVFGGAFAVNDAPVEPSNTSPDSELRTDRLTRLSIGAALGLLVGVPYGLLVGPAFGLAGGVAAGIAMAGSGAYFRFGQARLWLAWQGRLPLRLMAFLRDARERDVLRQVGTVYKFRHNRLQEHLVAKAGGTFK